MTCARFGTLIKAFVCAIMLLQCSNIRASTHIWKGANNGNWSLATNWTGNIKPTTGELNTIVYFALGNTSNADIAGLVVDQVQFGTSGNTINGTFGLNGVNLAINILDSSGGNTINANIALSGASCEINVTTGNLTLAGNISGTFGLLKVMGTGTLTITSATNSYLGGTYIDAGTLLLNSNGTNTAIPGDLTIGTGIGAAGSVVVRLLQNSEIADTSNVTIKSDGVFDLNNSGELVNSVTMVGGSVTLGTATLFTAGLLNMTDGLILGFGTGNIVLGGDITATSTVGGGASIACKMSLNGDRTITVNSGGAQPELTINSIIGDGSKIPSGIKKSGTGTLQLLNGSGNLYTGATTVDKGTVQMSAGFVIPGALVIGNNVDAANSATLQELNSGNLKSTTAVTINASGLLDMNGLIDAVASLSGSGNVTLGTSIAGGLLNVGDSTNTVFSGNIGGTGTFKKRGTGTLTLSGVQSFTGSTVVTLGTLALNSNAADSAITSSNLIIGAAGGAANTAVVQLLQSTQIANSTDIDVNASGKLDFNNFSDFVGTLTINGGSVNIGTGLLRPLGALTMNGGSIMATTGGVTLNADITATSTATAASTITAAVYLNGARTITVNPGASQPELTISGLIADGTSASSLLKNGTGTLAITGPASNTYTGTTTVDKGTLTLSQNKGFTIPGALTIGNANDPAGSATVKDLQGSDLNTNTSVTINPSGVLNLNGFSESITQLSGAGSLTVLGNGGILVGFGNATSSFSGVISGAGNFLKIGLGTVTLNGNNSYTGVTTITAGALIVNGAQGGSAVTLTSGTTLGGSGTVGNVTSTGGIISPGDPNGGTGKLSMGNLTLDAASSVIFDLPSSAAGAFDSISVTGTVNLGGATATLNAGATLKAGVSSKFLLIDNDLADAISGTFGNFAEGAAVTLNALSAKVSYIGGTGNDFTLSFANVPPVITTKAQATPSMAGIGQAVAFSVVASDANGDTLSYAWNFGDSSAAGSGAAPTHAYAALGTYNVSVAVSDGNGGTVSSSTSVTVFNLPPAITSAATATPSTAGVGQIVAFSVGVTDLDLDTLTYAWSFGDATTGIGATPTHPYTAAGTYAVSVVIDDGHGATTSSSTSVTVNAPLFGEGNDSDGDGFSDAFEIAAGTNPLDPNDKPANGSVQTPPSAQVGLSIKLNFAKPDSDSITLTGSLAIPAGFTVNGAKAIVDVGGVDHAFSLNQKGIGTDGKNSFKLSAKSKNGIAAAQTAKYAMKLVNGAFAAALASKGLIGTQNDPGSQHTITVSLVFAKTAYQTQKQVTYKCKKGKSGAAK